MIESLSAIGCGTLAGFGQTYGKAVGDKVGLAGEFSSLIICRFLPINYVNDAEIFEDRKYGLAVRFIFGFGDAWHRQYPGSAAAIDHTPAGYPAARTIF